MPDLYPKSSKIVMIPMVPMKRPRTQMMSIPTNNYHDQSLWMNEKNVMPRYPNTYASTAYAIT